MIRKTVAIHRLKELRHLRAVEKLATWRKTYRFDRLEDGGDHCFHGPLPPTPEQITANMWSDLNVLKDATSMSGKARSRQGVKSFFNELDRGIASFTDVEFAMLKRIVERRDRDAAHVTVAPIGTAQPCSPQSRSSEISFDARVYMEKNDERTMDPERDQLGSPSAGISFETPGQQCHPRWKTEDEPLLPPAACLSAWVRALGETLFPSPKSLLEYEPIAELQHRLQHQPPFSCRRAANLKTRRQPGKKTSNSTPVGKEGSQPS